MENKENNVGENAENTPYRKSRYVPKKPSGRLAYKINKKTEELEELVKRRNKRLSDFFKVCGLMVRVIGSNTPSIILNDRYIINAYVHNFELRFTDNHTKGNTVYTVRLTEKPNFDKNKVTECIKNYDMLEINKISIVNSSPTLYLSGYNFLNKEERLGRYPVFSVYAPKIYFTKEKADEICNELNQDGYNLISC